MHCIRPAGKAGSFYNVIQDLTHQVTMRLKIGILSDHIGTYIVSSATSLAPPDGGHLSHFRALRAARNWL